MLSRSGENLAEVGFVGETILRRCGACVFEDGWNWRPQWRPAWRGPAALGDARYLGIRLRIGSPPPSVTGGTALADGGWLARVVEPDSLDGRVRLSAAG